MSQTMSDLGDLVIEDSDVDETLGPETDVCQAPRCERPTSHVLLVSHSGAESCETRRLCVCLVHHMLAHSEAFMWILAGGGVHPPCGRKVSSEKDVLLCRPYRSGGR